MIFTCRWMPQTLSPQVRPAPNTFSSHHNATLHFLAFPSSTFLLASILSQCLLDRRCIPLGTSQLNFPNLVSPKLTDGSLYSLSHPVFHPPLSSFQCPCMASVLKKAGNPSDASIAFGPKTVMPGTTRTAVGVLIINAPLFPCFLLLPSPMRFSYSLVLILCSLRNSLFPCIAYLYSCFVGGCWVTLGCMYHRV